MAVLHIGGTEHINDPTQAEIESGIAALNDGSGTLISIIRDDQQHYFVQATKMQPDMFLLEYRDTYGHMAVDEPLSSAQLNDVLTTYAGGDDAWIKHFSWTPVEL